MTTQTTTVYRARCSCGWRSRKLTDPNGAVAAAEAHIGLDRERTRCPNDGYPRPRLHERCDDGTWRELGVAV